MGKGLIWLGQKIVALWVRTMKLWNKGLSYLMFKGVCDGKCKCCKQSK